MRADLPKKVLKIKYKKEQEEIHKCLSCEKEKCDNCLDPDVKKENGK